MCWQDEKTCSEFDEQWTPILGVRKLKRQTWTIVHTLPAQKFYSLAILLGRPQLASEAKATMLPLPRDLLTCQRPLLLCSYSPSPIRCKSLLPSSGTTTQGSTSQKQLRVAIPTCSNNCVVRKNYTHHHQGFPIHIICALYLHVRVASIIPPDNIVKCYNHDFGR